METRNVLIGLVVGLAVAGCGTEPTVWTPEMRDSFLQSCATATKGRPPAEVKQYCECTLGRLESSMTVAEYRAEESKMIAGGRTPSPRMTEIVLACLGVDPAATAPDGTLTWTADEQRQFLVGCIPAARNQLGTDASAPAKAAGYCRCALEQASRRMTATEYRTLERETAKGGGRPTSGPMREIADACAPKL